jgi:hypothetical protein
MRLKKSFLRHSQKEILMSNGTKRPRISKAEKELFDDTKYELGLLLLEYRQRDINGSHYLQLESDTKEQPELYLADDGLRDSLVALEKSLDSQLDEVFLKRYGFHNLCRLFNPDEKVYHYSIVKEKKFKHVNNQEKVLERLDGEYSQWKSRYKTLSLNTFAAETTRTQLEMDDFEAILEQKILEAGVELERIKENFETLDVRVISKIRAHSFYTLFYRQKKVRRGRPSRNDRGKSIVYKQIKRHISTMTPNVLWYKKGIRRDCSVDEFILKADNPFGDVYVMQNP